MNVTDDQAAGRRQNLITSFRLAANAMVAELAARVTAAGYGGIRPAHSRVFENLTTKGRTLAELAERAQMTHQSMSELVAALEAHGYVERRSDPRDRRAKLVCLTPRGRAVMRLALTEIARIQEEWLERLEQAGIRGDLPAAIERAVRMRGTLR